MFQKKKKKVKRNDLWDHDSVPQISSLAHLVIDFPVFGHIQKLWILLFLLLDDLAWFLILDHQLPKFKLGGAPGCCSWLCLTLGLAQVVISRLWDQALRDCLHTKHEVCLGIPLALMLVLSLKQIKRNLQKKSLNSVQAGMTEPLTLSVPPSQRSLVDSEECKAIPPFTTDLKHISISRILVIWASFILTLSYLFLTSEIWVTLQVNVILQLKCSYYKTCPNLYVW